jgi:hypothetical protein
LSSCVTSLLLTWCSHGRHEGRVGGGRVGDVLAAGAHAPRGHAVRGHPPARHTHRPRGDAGPPAARCGAPVRRLTHDRAGARGVWRAGNGVPKMLLQWNMFILLGR